MSENLKPMWDWFNSPHIMLQGATKLDHFAILFAKNKNNMLVSHQNLSIGGLGLNEIEAAELRFYTGIITGFLINVGKIKPDGSMDIQFVTDRVLNVLILASKNFGYNIGKNPMVYIEEIKK